jgi:hypothetical protein
MATAADVRALEAECPWLREDVRRDLAALRESTAAAAQRFAADVRVLARLRRGTARRTSCRPRAARPVRPWLPESERVRTGPRVWLDDDAPF